MWICEGLRSKIFSTVKTINKKLNIYIYLLLIKKCKNMQKCLGMGLVCSKIIYFIHANKKKLLELRSVHFVSLVFLSVPSFSVVEDHPGYAPTNHQASYSQNSSSPGWHRIGAICGERGARGNCGGNGSCRDVRATVYLCKNEGMLLEKIRRKSIIWKTILSYLGYCSLPVSIGYLLTFVGQWILLRSYVKLL